jgi:hypothetical protein
MSVERASTSHFSKSVVGDTAAHAGSAAKFARRHWLPVAATPVAAGGATAVALNAGRPKPKRHTGATVAGGAVAEGAWRGGGFAVQARGKAQERPHEGQSRSNYQKLVKDHKHAHGAGGLQGPELRTALQSKPEYFRKYPKELGGWRAKRVLGQMSGKRGLAIEAGVVAAGAAAAHKRASSSSFGKGFVATKTRDIARAVKPSAMLSHQNFVGFAGAGAGAIVAPRGKTPQARKRSSTVRSAVAGGIGGQLAYQGAGYAASEGTRKRVGWYKRVGEVHDPVEHTKIKHEQKMRGKWRRAHQEAGTWNTGAKTHYRDFPLEHRGAKVLRAVAHTHGGRTGVATGTAATAAGALVGIHGAHKRASSSSFGKRHRVEAAGGAALIVNANRRETGQLVSHVVSHDPSGQRLVADIKVAGRAARGAVSPTLVQNVAEVVRRYPILKSRGVGTALGVGMLVRSGRRR